MTPVGFTKTVTRIFDAVLDERRTAVALKAVADYVGASGASYMLKSKLTGQVSRMAWCGNFAGNRGDYLMHYSKIDPFRVLQEEAPCGSITGLRERLPQSFLRHDEWYNDYVLKGGVCDVLGTKLHENATHMVFASIHRGIADTGLFPRDIERLRMLIAPLRNAARLHIGLTEIGYRFAIMHGAQTTFGVFFTYADGKIVEMNEWGERILSAGDGFGMRDGRICARRAFETTKLAGLIAKAAAPSGTVPSAGCMLLGRCGDHPPYVARVAPVNAGIAGHDLPMAMILVSLPDEKCISARELTELFGLSPAESRLAVALAHGKHLIDLAGEFGVQVATLRTQLRSVLKKCEVRGQTDLVRLILSIPVVHPQPDALNRRRGYDGPVQGG